MITTGTKVRVMATGDDQLDWAAGLEGEVVSVRLVRDYLCGIENPKLLQAEYYSVTVRTDQGEVTVNDNEIRTI
jgi:hypothetical protein